MRSNTPVPSTNTQAKPATPAVAKCVPGEELTENGITYVRICGGTFTMGSAANDPLANHEKPPHQVTLSEFWIDKTEITNKQYRLFRPDHMGEDSLPVTKVSWTEAIAACERFGGRLPTEAEWEYAARAGSQTVWSFGDDEKMLGEYAWYEENSGGKPHDVGTKKPNKWGLYDMHGNVWEWVADWYGTYPSAGQTDPSGPTTGQYRVRRGGSFFNPPSGLRSAIRYWVEPEDRDSGIGFRCARGARRQP
jgi:formylglycine-generating enzyme required for sulfatase activity